MGRLIVPLPSVAAPTCSLCRGMGEVVSTTFARCCVGYDPWNEVFCGCAGHLVEDECWAPCPAGCPPPDLPEPPEVWPDPHAW